jgi:hypothetical protein
MQYRDFQGYDKGEYEWRLTKKGERALYMRGEVLIIYKQKRVIESPINTPLMQLLD